MDEVYVSGALTAIADGARARVFYELLAEIVTECGLRPYLPHQSTGGTDPIAAPDLDPRSAYDIDRARVARSGLVIAYAGTPSFGVGIEVEIARERGIPVILVAERDRTVSRILLGSPAVVDVVRFTDLAALRQALGDAIARVTKTASEQAPDAVVQRFLGSLGAARQLPEAEVAALTQGLLEVRPGRTPEDERARWLLAQSLSWHRREDKADWWAYFGRLRMTDAELVEEREAIGELAFVGDDVGIRAGG
jgi:hypothetical protein